MSFFYLYFLWVSLPIYLCVLNMMTFRTQKLEREQYTEVERIYGENFPLRVFLYYDIVTQISH